MRTAIKMTPIENNHRINLRSYTSIIDGIVLHTDGFFVTVMFDGLAVPTLDDGKVPWLYICTDGKFLSLKAKLFFKNLLNLFNVLIRSFMVTKYFCR